MKKNLLLSLLPLFLLAAVAPAQKKSVFKIYKDSTEISYTQLLDEFSDADVVLFGELHNHALIHWLELEVLADLENRSNISLKVGMEMFERDDQLVIDEYFEGWIDTRNFEKAAKLWNNYATDYKPILEYCRKQDIPFYATDIPRRYASVVAHNGLDTLKNLSPAAKKYLPKLPVKFDPDAPGYALLAGMGKHGPGMNFLPQAQAIKDATMAETILKNRKKGQLFLHYNGAFHSKNGGGIYWYLQQKKPKLDVIPVEIKLSKKDSLPLPSNPKTGGVITLVVPENFTRTYR